MQFPGVETIALSIASAFLLATLAPVWDRNEQRRIVPFPPGALATGLGVVAYAVSFTIRRLAAARFGIGEPRDGGDSVAIAFSVLVMAPLDESLRAVGLAIPLRSRRLRRPYDAMRLALGAGVGFAMCVTIERLLLWPLTPLTFARTSLDALTHLALTSLVGFAVGRDRRRSLGGRTFSRVFLAAVVFGAVASYLLLGRGTLALWAAIPLVVSTLATAFVARRDLLALSESPRSRRSRLPRPPTIAELERALLGRRERPVLFRWILLAAFVTSGVLTALVAGAVVLAQRINVDFAAIDEAAAFEQSAPPLILLGTALLAAFPVSGFLVARASAARSVLEPALGASIAIIGIVTLLGLAAPVAVVFGLALAPVAFALSCAGAWVGLER
ncbi:MAG: PrsW family glutamic-type intramembrane protease [Polyangiaceae bacterium]